MNHAIQRNQRATAPQKEKSLSQKILIRQARALFKPSPVRHHHVPDWLRRALLRAFGFEGSTSGLAVLFRALERLDTENRYPHWLDHWGSTLYRGRPALVAEPYGVGEREIQGIATLADRCGCGWRLDANSWWFPSKTIRILIYQST